MKALIASVLLIVSFWSSANTTGNELYELYKESQKSEPSDFYDVGKLVGYLNGVTESYEYYNILCFPKGVTNGQLLDMVGKHLADNPADRNKNASRLIYDALGESFPCEE